jgi:hypothetical protein
VNALLNHKWGVSSAQDRVWAQVTGLASDIAVRRLFMALNFQAFIDDSRTTGGEFTKEWEPILPLGTKDKNGKYHFKMSEMARAGRMHHVETFYKVIEKHVALSISCRMNQADFARALEWAKYSLSQVSIYPNFGKWSNPYYFLFRALIDNFHKDRHDKISKIIPIDERVDFIFDNQTEKSFIKKAWEGWVAFRDDEVRSRYGDAPRFEKDEEYVALQGADLWAWWVREWYEEDSDPLPDKMKEFDFGLWRGEKRPLTYYSLGEKQIKEMFQNLAIQMIPTSWVDPV